MLKDFGFQKKSDLAQANPDDDCFSLIAEMSKKGPILPVALKERTKLYESKAAFEEIKKRIDVATSIEENKRLGIEGDDLLDVVIDVESRMNEIEQA